MTREVEEVPITEIPPDLHPLAWEIPEEAEGDATVQVLMDARKAGEDSFKRIYLTHKRVMDDPTHTREANLNRSKNFADKITKAFDKSFHAAIVHTDQRIKSLDAAMNRVPKMPPESLAVQIAARLASLSPEDRINRISEAMKNGEMDTIGAALFFSDAWLSGLSPNRREIFRAQYREMTYPEHVKQRAYTEKLLNQLVRGRNSYETKVGKLYDTKAIERARKLAEAAEAALQ